MEPAFMRFVLAISATAMSLLIALQFTSDPPPAMPFKDFTVALICPNDGNRNSEVGRAISTARQAAIANLGCRVVPVFLPADGELLAQEFRQFAANFPDGIAIMGYPANDALLVDIEETLDQDVRVTSFNSRFPAGENQFQLDGFGFSGSDGYAAGYRLARAALAKHNLQPDDTALIIGDLSHSAREDFYNGASAALNEGGLTVASREVTTYELQMAHQDFVRWLAAEREAGTLPDLICFTEIPIRLAAEAMERARIKPGSVPLIGLGTEPTLDEIAMKSDHWGRHISLIASQDIALQAYMAIVQICLSKSSFTPGLRVDTPVEILGLGRTSPTLKSNEKRFIHLN